MTCLNSQPGVLTQDELDAMSEEAARYLPSVVDIYRSLGGDNQAGGQLAGRVLVGNDVPARLSPNRISATLAQAADRESVKMFWILTLPTGTDIEPQDLVLWKTRKFIIIQPLERDYEVTLRVMCDEVID